MKLKSKIFAGILSLIIPLSLAGCTNEKNDSGSIQNPIGRYTEEEVQLPVLMDNISELVLWDESVAYVDSMNFYLYRENEKKTSFTAQSLKMPETYINIWDETVSPSGECYIFYSVNNGEFIVDEDEILCGIVKPDEEFRYFSIDIDKSYQLYNVKCSEDGRLFAIVFDRSNYTVNIISVDTVTEKTEIIFTYPNTNNRPSLDIVGNRIISVFGDDLLFINLTDNKLEETPEAIKAFMQEQQIGEKINIGHPSFDICAGEDNSIYIACESGLYRYVINGNQVEQLIDGITCHIGNPSWEISSVIQKNDGSFMIAFTNGKIMRYRYDKNAGREYDSQLNIFSFSKNTTAMYAIEEFKSLYPNVSINYRAVSEENMDFSQAMEQLEAEISSDNPPDIIITDDLNADRLIKNNMLENLSEYESKIIPEEGILENISKPLSNGGWYTMPCRFSLPFIAGRKKDIEKISSLSDIIEMKIEQNKDNTRYVLANYDLEGAGFVKPTMHFAWKEIVTESGINSENLKKYLTNIKKYEMFTVNRPRSDINNAYDCCMMYIYNFQDDGSIVHCNASGVKDLMTLNTLDKIDSRVGYRMDAITENGYIPSCILSVCSKAKNKENAVKFLQTAVSDNVQSIESGDGLPVNLGVIEKWPNRKYRTANTFNDTFVGISSPSSGKFVEIYNIRGEDYVKTVDMLKNLDTPLCDKGNIINAIITYTKEYLREEISIEEAVQKIEASALQ